VTVNDTATQLPGDAYADLDGFRLHYHDIGSGPALLMLHGGGPGASAWSNFKQNVERLSTRFRLLLVDQPGFGRSDKPVHDRPQHELTAEKLIALLNLLEIEKATPVGNSIGGAAALELALQAPQRVDRLILMAPAGGSLPVTSQPSPESKLMFRFYAGEGASLDRMKQLFRGMAYDSRKIPESTVQERYDAATDPDAAAYSTRLFAGWSRLGPRHWQRISEISHETLLMWGREDRIIPLDASLHMLHQMPNARLVVFPRCGHWCQLEVPGDFEDQIIGFLGRG
jgi:2-hydroxy-6-oxonona-2,4-dienedioate hydrolase/4,5:9,10-diseco-3-hydroxy-5,9,17-trioxoandrosta-1(10),2-diene-4-oate hydrolase